MVVVKRKKGKCVVVVLVVEVMGVLVVVEER